MTVPLTAKFVAGDRCMGTASDVPARSCPAGPSPWDFSKSFSGVCVPSSPMIIGVNVRPAEKRVVLTPTRNRILDIEY